MFTECLSRNFIFLFVIGGCKHALALLAWIHRRSEEKSCTENLCYWVKPPLMQIGTNLKYVKAKCLSSHSQTPALLDNANFMGGLLSECEKRQTDVMLATHTFPLKIKSLHALSLHKIMIQCDADNSDFLLFSGTVMTTNLCEQAAAATVNQANGFFVGRIEIWENNCFQNLRISPLQNTRWIAGQSNRWRSKN